MSSPPQPSPSGASDDPLQVEITEAIEIKPNGSRIARSGRRWITMGYILLAVGATLGLVVSWHAAATARRTADALQAEVIKRCNISEQSRGVLRREHVAKLQLARERLADVLEFKHGRPIPAGFTQKDIDRGIARARADIRVEESVLRDVRPVPCKEEG